MATWRTNFHLTERSNELANSMLNTTTGQSPNVPGAGGAGDGEAVVRDTLLADAEYFMSMDPERLEQEFNDQVQAANVRLVQAVLDPNVWHGTAADTFHKQMTHIETFMDQQSAQAAGMMFAVSVQYRESFYDLADKTIAVCRAKINSTVGETPKWKSLTADVAGAVKGLVTGKTVADLGSWTIDQILAATKLFADTDVQDGEPTQIVDGYLIARNALVSSYESNVGTIGSWIASRRTDLDQLKLPLLEPLPSTTDVDSPDFRYENFAYREPVPGVDNTSVERERTSYVEEKPKPGGLIGPRLAGEG